MPVHSRIALEFGNVGFWGEGKTGVPGEKPLDQSTRRVENQQQTQLAYDVGSGNWARDTLVGGKHSYHCAIPAPQIKSES